MGKKSLLEGNIRSQLIGLAFPLFLGNVLQQLYNTADSLIVSMFLGMEAFASTGVSGTIMNLFIFILHGFCNGISVLFSASFGANDKKSFREQLYTALAFGSVFTIFLSILFIILARPALRLIQTPDELMPYCQTYLTIILGGLIATYMYNLFAGILQSVGDTKASLYFLTVSVVSNIVLDFLFVGVFSFGIKGAAVATVTAQAFSAFCCFIYFAKKYPELLCRKEDAGFHKHFLSSILEYGISTAMHQSTLYIGKITVQGIVNTMGTSVIAAYTAVARIEGFINSPGDSGSQAMAIFISQNRAADKKERVREALGHSFRLLTGFVIALSVFMYFVSPTVLRFFLTGNDPVAINAGMSYLRIIFFLYIWCYLGNFFVGSARGHGRMRVPVVGTMTHLTFRILISNFFIGKLGLAAVAIGTGIGWFFCDIYHGAMFYRIRKAER